MTSDLVIGSLVSTGAPVTVNVPTLLRSGLLVQSNTGGGKSWLLRVLAEQLSPLVPVIVIDPEGEFSSLRARFPFVLIGPGGDAPASVAGARLTAERLLELRSNAVIDLFELKPLDRQLFVAAFFEAITEAPKSLWHDTVIMLDEAHKYAPEKGDSPAGEHIATAASVWRKRGKCLIAATQRLAKFNKDAAAELQNKAIGPTFMDIDRERCAEELGVARADKVEFNRTIKSQAPGSFWMLGRAVCQERLLVRTRAVVSAHPEAGSKRHLDPPPAPEKIRHLLPQLVDLPKEAETKLKTEADLRAEIKRLRLDLAQDRGGANLAGRVSADAIKVAAERDKWHGIAVAAEGKLSLMKEEFEGMTAFEVRRLREMEVDFNQVIDAVDHYQAWNRERLKSRRLVKLSPELVGEASVPVNPDGHKSFRVTLPDPQAAGLMARRLKADPAYPQMTDDDVEGSTSPKKGWTAMEEELYQKFKARLIEEVPGLLRVLATAPEIEVVIERKIIEIDGKSLRGRLARLLAEGYLDTGKKNGEIVKELGRTGPSANFGSVSVEIKQLIALGFIHNTDGGRFILAPGAKVNIKR